jgi:hypothetical protein
MVPAEVVCVLHYARWAETEEDVTTALRLLDAYPPEARAQECFRELRRAVLGRHAERAWAGERFAEAGVLWQAMAELAPERPEVAVNLAMLATRTRSSAYRPAWDGAAERFYAAAARAGDLRYQAADRVALHRAHSMQSLRAAGSNQPDSTELRRWLADGDAVEVWLREWDLYHLNARLDLRSPSHVLAVPPDTGDEQREQARDALLRHVELSVGGRGWTGAAEFVRLATERIAQAYASEPPDIHQEIEQSAADELLDEALSRALLLRRLAGELSAGTVARPRALACAVLRHLFQLPLPALERHCAERGVLTSDESLMSLLDETAADVARNWTGSTPNGTADVARMLADVEVAGAAAPRSAGLAVPHGRLLLWSGRGPEAYARVAAALPGTSSPWIRAALAAIVDRYAIDRLTNADEDADDPTALTRERRLMAELPLSIQPRIAVAARLLRMGGGARRAEAVRLLADGARGALTDSLRDVLYREVRRLPKAADDDVRRLVEEQWKRSRRDGDVDGLEHAVRLAEARRFPAKRLRDELTKAWEKGGPDDVHG